MFPQVIRGDVLLHSSLIYSSGFRDSSFNRKTHLGKPSATPQIYQLSQVATPDFGPLERAEVY